MIFASVSLNPTAIFLRTVKDFECYAKIYDFKVYCFLPFRRSRIILLVIRWLRRRLKCGAFFLFFFLLRSFYTIWNSSLLLLWSVCERWKINKHFFSSCLECRLIQYVDLHRSYNESYTGFWLIQSITFSCFAHPKFFPRYFCHKKKTK